MSTRHDDADRFLEEIRQTDPLRYAEIVEQFPVNTAEDNYRHAHGRRRLHRRADGVTMSVPRAQRRRFTDEEWLEVQEAIRRGRKECDENEKYAKRLADEGM